MTHILRPNAPRGLRRSSLTNLARTLAGGLLLLSCCAAALAAAQTDAAEANRPVAEIINEGAFDFSLEVSAAQVERTMEPRQLGGTNIALWNSREQFRSPLIKQWVEELQPGLIRLPGGSWSNCHYWNGHGVRDENGKVDPSKMGPDGYPAVDYSAYAPGFNVDSSTLRPGTGFHGNVDVKTLHDWVKSIPGAQPMPCLNAGTGRAVDAAEWVKWAAAQDYQATYWEIGNELDGSWEPGHHLPFGKGTITDALWSQRYHAIGAAVRREQPSAKIGACAFHLPLVRDGGDLVDFVAIHTYPGSTTASDQENLAEAPRIIAREVAKVRSLIDTHQPTRKDHIEIGYTEWNLSGGLNASDLFSGLWTSSVLAAFAKNGVTFATQWDLLTHSKGMKDGHALIFEDGNAYTRKAGYYALWLWNNFTGSKVLAAREVGETHGVQTLSTRDTDAIYLLLMNPDGERPALITVKLDDFEPAAMGEQITLSSREYFWNPHRALPQWSSAPRSQPIHAGAEFQVTVPPFSVTHLRVPSKDKPALSTIARSQPAESQPKVGPSLHFILPPEIYVGDRTEGHLHASLRGSEDSYPAPLKAATLSAEGNVTLDRQQVRLAEAFGSFQFTFNDDKPVTFIARTGNVEERVTVHPKPSVPRPQLVWDFQKQSPSEAKTFNSNFELRADPSQRPNKDVARIDIAPGAAKPKPGVDHRVVYRINALPPEEQLNRSNIRGLFFDIKTLGFTNAKSNARLTAVMQSPANYWMVLGSTPLDGTTEWKRIQFDVTREAHIKAMAAAYNVWFVLEGDESSTGTICLDKIGFMVR